MRILVTGASRGIGAALCAELRARGEEAIGVARTPGDGVLRCDVSVPGQVVALRGRTGPVDVLINNAGVIHVPGPLVDLPIEEWERIFRVNVYGVVSMLRAYVPEMNRRGKGIVLNVSSGWGRFAEALQSPYCASKFALEALTASLAQEVSPGVLVAAVNPGVVQTDMLRTCFEGDLAAYDTPEECAHSLANLLLAIGPEHHGRSLDAADFRGGRGASAGIIP